MRVRFLLVGFFGFGLLMSHRLRAVKLNRSGLGFRVCPACM